MPSVHGFIVRLAIGWCLWCVVYSFGRCVVYMDRFLVHVCNTVRARYCSSLFCLSVQLSVCHSREPRYTVQNIENNSKCILPYCCVTSLCLCILWHADVHSVAAATTGVLCCQWGRCATNVPLWPMHWLPTMFHCYVCVFFAIMCTESQCLCTENKYSIVTVSGNVVFFGTEPFHPRANSFPGAKVPVGTWPIRSRSQELSLPVSPWDWFVTLASTVLCALFCIVLIYCWCCLTDWIH